MNGTGDGRVRLLAIGGRGGSAGWSGGTCNHFLCLHTHNISQKIGTVHFLFIQAFLTTDTFACSRRVQWQHLNTGNCAVDYTIQFRNSCGSILGTVAGIRNVSFYCTDDYAHSSFNTMWAVKNGVKGTKSRLVALFTTPKAITIDTKGMHIAFPSFVFCLFACFSIIYTNPKKKTFLHITN